MDLYLIDAILKGHIPASGHVLDVGCGEGRNGIYFLKQGYDYHGIDTDKSKIQLLQYLSSSLHGSPDSFFEIKSLEELVFENKYDVIIASRILHFAKNHEQFQSNWQKLTNCLKEGGVIYFAMDSAMVKEAVQHTGEGRFSFGDGRVSYALSANHYEQMQSGMDAIEPLRTVVYDNTRVQSFGLLRKH